METLGIVFLVIGGLISLAGGIMFLIVTFQESVIWGLVCLFVPFAAFVFLFMHWDKAGKPFLIQLAGGAFLVVGIMMGGKIG